MAEPVAIQGSSHQGKIRNPLGVIGLSIITLGIYYFVWYYKVNKEMAEIGQARGTEECGTSPGDLARGHHPGLHPDHPAVLLAYKACTRLTATEGITGAQEGMEPPLLWLLLILVGPVGLYLFQRNLNRSLEAQAGGANALSRVPPQHRRRPSMPASQPQPQSPGPESPSGPQSPAQ